MTFSPRLKYLIFGHKTFYSKVDVGGSSSLTNIYVYGSLCLYIYIYVFIYVHCSHHNSPHIKILKTFPFFARYALFFPFAAASRHLLPWHCQRERMLGIGKGGQESWGKSTSSKTLAPPKNYFSLCFFRGNFLYGFSMFDFLYSRKKKKTYCFIIYDCLPRLICGFWLVITTCKHFLHAHIFSITLWKPFRKIKYLFKGSSYSF